VCTEGGEKTGITGRGKTGNTFLASEGKKKKLPSKDRKGLRGEGWKETTVGGEHTPVLDKKGPWKHDGKEKRKTLLM